MHLPSSTALFNLEASGKLFLEVFRHGSLTVELYQPKEIDYQTPHDRDEVYVIVSGSGDFVLDGIRSRFLPGDFMFVAAGKPHHFENFTSDFSTWVLFYGPKGGEEIQTEG